MRTTLKPTENDLLGTIQIAYFQALGSLQCRLIEVTLNADCRFAEAIVPNFSCLTSLGWNFPRWPDMDFYWLLKVTSSFVSDYHFDISGWLEDVGNALPRHVKLRDRCRLMLLQARGRPCLPEATMRRGVWLYLMIVPKVFQSRLKGRSYCNCFRYSSSSLPGD